jgi:two-component system sensor histidine kinase/response regulator
VRLPPLRRRPTSASRPGTSSAGSSSRGGGGKRTLYRSLLRKFVASHADVATRLRQQLERAAGGDRSGLEEAQRLAHSLKGVAGNLGATAVQQRAADLEQRLHAGAPLAEIESLRGPLEDALTPLLDGLARQLPDEPVELPPVAPIDHQQLREVIALLDRQLDEGDAEAQDTAAHHAVLLSSVMGEQHHRFTHAISRYAFDEARTMLREQVGRDADLRHGPSP